MKITYDGDTLAIGDAIWTKTGRWYGVLEVRVQTRGKYAGRQHARLLVLDEAPPPTKTHPLVWNYRGKKR